MQTVVHKIFGFGEVISKEIKEKEILLTVRFSTGKEMRFAAESFTLGVVTAEGDLKEEIDRMLAAKKEAEEERRNAMRAIMVTPVVPRAVTSKQSGRKPNRKVVVKGPIQTQYEAYLESAGYSIVGRTGKDSTVPAYAYAVEQVLKEENLAWAELEKNIAQIVKKYDMGGACEDFGAKSNRTVINALKRFAEFVETRKLQPLG